MIESYLSVSGENESETVIERSRFICRVKRIGNEDEARAFIEGVRKAHSQATHNCYAYVASEDGNICRFSDDGEPQGTAGLPMLEALKNRSLAMTAAVVTRYFGGIKLGAGGLVRAYTRSVSDAVDAAGLVSMEPCTTFSVHVPYPYRNAVWSVFQRFGAIESTDYGAEITCAFRCRSAEADAFLKALSDRTEGRVGAEAIGEGYFGFPIQEQN